MDALKLLTNRRSSKKLKHPAPDAAELEQILQAATQVSDHGNMRPFRFTVIQGEVGLQRFRDVLANGCRTEFRRRCDEKGGKSGQYGADGHRGNVCAEPRCA